MSHGNSAAACDLMCPYPSLFPLTSPPPRPSLAAAPLDNQMCSHSFPGGVGIAAHQISTMMHTGVFMVPWFLLDGFPLTPKPAQPLPNITPRWDLPTAGGRANEAVLFCFRRCGNSRSPVSSLHNAGRREEGEGGKVEGRLDQRCEKRG